MGFPSGEWLRICLTMQETQEMQVRFPGWEVPWRRKWQPISVFLTGEFHGERSPAGHSPLGRKELDMTKAT